MPEKIYFSNDGMGICGDLARLAVVAPAFNYLAREGLTCGIEVGALGTSPVLKIVDYLKRNKVGFGLHFNIGRQVREGLVGDAIHNLLNALAWKNFVDLGQDYSLWHVEAILQQRTMNCFRKSRSVLAIENGKTPASWAKTLRAVEYYGGNSIVVADVVHLMYELGYRFDKKDWKRFFKKAAQKIRSDLVSKSRKYYLHLPLGLRVGDSVCYEWFGETGSLDETGCFLREIVRASETLVLEDQPCDLFDLVGVSGNKSLDYLAKRKLSIAKWLVSEIL